MSVAVSAICTTASSGEATYRLRLTRRSAASGNARERTRDLVVLRLMRLLRSKTPSSRGSSTVKGPRS